MRRTSADSHASAPRNTSSSLTSNHAPHHQAVPVHELATDSRPVPLRKHCDPWSRTAWKDAGWGIAPPAGLFLAFTIFSAYTVFMKKAISDGSNPIVLAFLREILATSVLLPAAYLSQRTKPESMRRFWPEAIDLGWFMLLGGCMIWGAQLMSALALVHITPGNYALFAPTVPVLTLSISLLTGYEYFNRRSWLSWVKVGSIAVTASGALYVAVDSFVNAPPSLDTDGRYRNPLLGNVLLMFNKCCVAIYPIIEKHLLQRYEPLVIVAWGYAMGAILMVMSVVPCAMNPAAWNISSSGVGAIIYSGLLSSAFNYTLMCWINKHTSPVMVMSFYPYQSICTPLLAWLFLGNTVSTSDAVGGFIIVCGLVCCVVARAYERQHGALSSMNGFLEAKGLGRLVELPHVPRSDSLTGVGTTGTGEGGAHSMTHGDCGYPEDSQEGDNAGSSLLLLESKAACTDGRTLHHPVCRVDGVSAETDSGGVLEQEGTTAASTPRRRLDGAAAVLMQFK